MLSEFALRFVSSPLHRGAMEDATHCGVWGEPGNGPYVQIWLKIEEGFIRNATFKTPGCPSSTATAGVLCALITGREVDRVKELNEKDLLAVVGTLPEGKGHCGQRAISALRSALEAHDQPL